MLVLLSGDVTAASASRSVYPNFHCLIRPQAVGSSEPSTVRGRISPIVCCGRLFTSDKRVHPLPGSESSLLFCHHITSPCVYIMCFCRLLDRSIHRCKSFKAHVLLTQVSANTEALTEAVCSLWPRYGTGLSSHFQRASSVMSFFLAALLRP